MKKANCSPMIIHAVFKPSNRKKAAQKGIFINVAWLANHFDITLTAFAHVAAAAPGRPTALDTHWIWQDGQNLLKDTPQIRDGYLQVPDKPGMGVTIDMDKVEEANKLYNQLPSHDRNDAEAMQYLIPGWKYDSKKPALVR